MCINISTFPSEHGFILCKTFSYTYNKFLLQKLQIVITLNVNYLFVIMSNVTRVHVVTKLKSFGFEK